MNGHTDLTQQGNNDPLLNAIQTLLALINNITDIERGAEIRKIIFDQLSPHPSALIELANIASILQERFSNMQLDEKNYHPQKCMDKFFYVLAYSIFDEKLNTTQLKRIFSFEDNPEMVAVTNKSGLLLYKLADTKNNTLYLCNQDLYDIQNKPYPRLSHIENFLDASIGDQFVHFDEPDFYHNFGKLLTQQLSMTNVPEYIDEIRDLTRDKCILFHGQRKHLQQQIHYIHSLLQGGSLILASSDYAEIEINAAQQMNKPDIQKYLRQYRDIIRDKNRHPHDIELAKLEYIALTLIVMHRASGLLPNTRQLLALLLALQGKENTLVDNLVAEEKTWLLAIAAAFKSIKHDRVHIHADEREWNRIQKSRIPHFLEYMQIENIDCHAIDDVIRQSASQQSPDFSSNDCTILAADNFSLLENTQKVFPVANTQVPARSMKNFLDDCMRRGSIIAFANIHSPRNNVPDLFKKYGFSFYQMTTPSAYAWRSHAPVVAKRKYIGMSLTSETVKEAHFRMICRRIIHYQTNNHPILIICKDEEYAASLHAYLLDHHSLRKSRNQLLYAHDEYKAVTLQYAGLPGKITITTLQNATMTIPAYQAFSMVVLDTYLCDIEEQEQKMYLVGKKCDNELILAEDTFSSVPYGLSHIQDEIKKVREQLDKQANTDRSKADFYSDLKNDFFQNYLRCNKIIDNAVDLSSHWRQFINKLDEKWLQCCNEPLMNLTATLVNYSQGCWKEMLAVIQAETGQVLPLFEHRSTITPVYREIPADRNDKKLSIEPLTDVLVHFEKQPTLDQEKIVINNKIDRLYAKITANKINDNEHVDQQQKICQIAQFFLDEMPRRKQKNLAHHNQKFLQMVARLNNKQINHAIQQLYQRHFQSHKGNHASLLAHMTSLYGLRNLGIIDAEAVESKMMTGVSGENAWYDIYAFARKKMDAYQSIIFKGENRSAQIARLKVKLEEINQSKDKSSKKISKLLEQLDIYSREASALDLKKDKEIGKLGKLTYCNISGSRFQNTLTAIKSKAMPYFLEQKLYNDEHTEIEMAQLSYWINLLMLRVELPGIIKHSAASAIKKDFLLNQSINWSKIEIAQILERLLAYRKLILPEDDGYAIRSLASTMDFVLNKIHDFIQMQKISEIAGTQKEKVYTSSLNILRQHLQNSLSKLNLADYFKQQINIEKFRKFIPGETYEDYLALCGLAEMEVAIKLSYPDIYDVAVYQANYTDKRLYAIFSFTDENNQKKMIQFDVQSFSKDYLQKKYHLVELPKIFPQGYLVDFTWEKGKRITHAACDVKLDEHEILFNRNYYEYLKHLAAKITPDVEKILQNVSGFDEVKKMLGTQKDKQPSFDPHYKYNRLYTSFLSSLRENIHNISDVQLKRTRRIKGDSIQPENSSESFIKDYPPQNLEITKKFREEMDNFILGIYFNEADVLQRCGEFAQSQLQGLSLFLKKDKKIIRKKIMGMSDIDNYFERKAKEFEHEYKSSRASLPSADQRESKVRRFGDTVGSTYQPQLSTNIPTAIDNENLLWTELSCGTQVELVKDDLQINPLFIAMLEAQARRYPSQQGEKRKITHLYINFLRFSPSKKIDLLGEKQRECSFSKKLHEAESTHKNLAVITLPANSKLMSHKMLSGIKPTEEIDAVKKQIIASISSEAHDFHMDDSIRKMIYGNDETKIINGLLDKSMTDLGFTQRQLLSKAEVQALYVHFTKFHLANHFIKQLQPVSVNGACKDNADRGRIFSLWLDLALSCQSGHPMSEEQFIRGLHARAILVKGRAMNKHSDIFWNAVCLLMDGNPEGFVFPAYLIRMKKNHVIQPVLEQIKASEKLKKYPDETATLIATLNQLIENPHNTSTADLVKDMNIILASQQFTETFSNKMKSIQKKIASMYPQYVASHAEEEKSHVRLGF